MAFGVWCCWWGCAAGDFDLASVPKHAPTPGHVRRLIVAAGRPVPPPEELEAIADQYAADSGHDFRHAALIATDPEWNETADGIALEVHRRKATVRESIDWFRGSCADRAIVLAEIREQAQRTATKVGGVVSATPSGEPIAKAIVRCGGVRTESDRNGRYELTIPRRNYWYRVDVWAKGHAYVAQSLKTKIADDVGKLDFALPAGTSLSGRALRSDGAPAAGAMVHAVAWIGSKRFNGRSAIADAAGNYTVENLPEGGAVSDIVVELEGCCPIAIHKWPPQPLGELRDTPPELRMAEAKMIRGVVVDGQDRPVPLAEVQLRLRGRAGYVGIAYSDNAGRFVLPQSNDDTLVVAEKAGYALAWKYLGTNGGGGDAVRLALTKGKTIRGVVLESDGKPARNCMVGWPCRASAPKGTGHDGRDDDRHSNHMTRTDDEGRFDLGPLEPGELWAFSALGEAPRRKAEAEAIPGRAAVELKLAPTDR